MEEGFKTFLAKKEITVDEYKGGSLEAKAKLVEAFEKSKPKGKLSSYSVLSIISLSFLMISCCEFILMRFSFCFFLCF